MAKKFNVHSDAYVGGQGDKKVMSFYTKLGIFIFIACLIFGLYTLGYTIIVDKSEKQARYESILKDIDEAKSTLDEKNADVMSMASVVSGSSVEEVQEDVSGLFSDIAKKGEFVASLQNNLTKGSNAISAISESEPDAVEKSDKLISSFNDMKSSLKDYISPAESLDFFTTWVNNISDDYVWSFCSLFTFNGSRVPVMWKLYDTKRPEHPLMAYVTGEYYTSSNTFSDLTLYKMTAIQYNDTSAS